MAIIPEKINFNNINEIKKGDAITPETINAPLKASAYAQEIASAVKGVGTNQPNNDNANNVGEPRVEIETLADGTKRLTFYNLKGDFGSGFYRVDTELPTFVNTIPRSKIYPNIPSDIKNGETLIFASGECARVISTSNGVVTASRLSINLKGEKGDKGDTGKTSLYIHDFYIDNDDFINVPSFIHIKMLSSQSTKFNVVSDVFNAQQVRFKGNCIYVCLAEYDINRGGMLYEHLEGLEFAENEPNDEGYMQYEVLVNGLIWDMYFNANTRIRYNEINGITEL